MECPGIDWKISLVKRTLKSVWVEKVILSTNPPLITGYRCRKLGIVSKGKHKMVKRWVKGGNASTWIMIETRKSAILLLFHPFSLQLPCLFLRGSSLLGIIFSESSVNAHWATLEFSQWIASNPFKSHSIALSLFKLTLFQLCSIWINSFSSWSLPYAVRN